jgi:parvulin-like peptidyl-prolyl isomerase
MPYVVNGHTVPKELIRQESERISRDLTLQSIADEAERARRLRGAAEQSAVDRMLIAQAAANDQRPLDKDALEREVQRLMTQRGCRNGDDEAALRQFVEHQLRCERTAREMVAGAPDPSPDEVEAFYQQNRDNFRNPELFQAAHIVKRVNHEQSEEQAEAAIQAALAELERGDTFAEVAERHSDCKGNGIDLGRFPAGHMVPEFDEALRSLEPGQRTGIFTTPFGFHIAELRARIPAGPASFEEVRGDIERVFMMRNEHALYLRAVADLRSRADIRFVPDAQPATA